MREGRLHVTDDFGGVSETRGVLSKGQQERVGDVIFLRQEDIGTDVVLGEFVPSYAPIMMPIAGKVGFFLFEDLFAYFWDKIPRFIRSDVSKSWLGHNIEISYFDICDGLTDGGVESFRVLDCSLATLEQNSMSIFIGLEIVIDKRVVDTESCLEVAGFDSVEHNNVAQLNVKLDTNVRQVLDQPKTNAEAVRLISCLSKNCSTATLELSLVKSSMVS
ncbi:hypothetical protein KCU93_g31, partial [Aureobasidium melanogenum]